MSKSVFFAKLKKGDATKGHHSTLVEIFDDIQVNRDNAYSDGYFIAPMDGIYYFTVRVTFKLFGKLHLNVRKTNSFSRYETSTNDKPKTGILRTIQMLNQGNRVSANFYGSCDSGDFYGFLLK